MSSKMTIEKILECSLDQGVCVDNSFYVPVPDQYKNVDFSFLSDYADSVVIVPKNFPQGTDPADAELALIIQSQRIPCGMMYNPEKRKIYTELFTKYHPVFSADESVELLDLSENFGILAQFSSGTDPVLWFKYHGLVFVKNNAYLFHLISNQKTNLSGELMDRAMFCNLTVEWLKMIMLPEDYEELCAQREQQRCQAEAEERRRLAEEQVRQRKKAEERRKQEEELARQRQKVAEYRTQYNNLVQERQEQERIAAENRGWFGIQAQKRKLARMRIQELNEQLAREFPSGCP